jgi:hypothetical protein
VQRCAGGDADVGFLPCFSHRRAKGSWLLGSQVGVREDISEEDTCGRIHRNQPGRVKRMRGGRDQRDLSRVATGA